MTELVRSVTKWTKACDKRLARLMSCIHHTNEFRQSCHVGNTAQHCGLGLFQDSDFAGDLEDSTSTSGGTSCFFESRTFVPISWMCKKLTSVSYSSTESDHFVGCWVANGWATCSRLMGCGERSVTFIEQYQTTNQPRSRKLFAESQIHTTDLRLIGYLISSIWTPKSKSFTVTPKTNSQTC